MDKPKKLTTKQVILILVAVFLVCGCALGGVALARNRVKKVAADEEFTYVNPDETKAEADEGFAIDGVFDEEQYQNNNWLYLHNTDKYADVDVSMTNYFGEKGMYFAYDVTDRKSVYVNLERSSTMNSCIEMYLATNSTLSKASNHLFEIDLLPTGDMSFKKTNGKGGFENVMTSNDIMAYLGATTKGGAVNTEECTGYCLELFIPWEYMEKFGIDSEEIKNSYIYVTPAHITSFNYEGTDGSNDRYWYFFAEQQGASMDTVYQYFRFNEDGVIGTTPTKVVEGEHCSITGDPVVIPGMKTTYTITPEEGYAVNSVLVNGEEYIQHASYNEDGEVLLEVRGKKDGLEIKATAEAITEGTKTLSGTVEVDGGSLNGVSVSYKGVNGKKAIEIDKNGKFVLPDLQQGYYKITVEKEGYEKLERGIYLNRDINTELDFVTFNVDTGKSWVLDAPEDNILYKFGGRGIILSKESYDKFTVEVNLKFDEELAKEYDHTYFTQQRQGIRIKFSNEKCWDIDVMLEKGVYKVQYAAFAGDKSVFTSYKNLYNMTEEEIAMYTGKDGVKLKVLRDGKYANVYLNDRLISIEVLGDEYAKCSAQVGFEAWTANRVVEEYKYQIKTDAKGIIKNTLFSASAGWDISGQFDGYLSMPKGGNGSISFVDKYVNMDLTLKVRDYQNSTDKEGVNPRTDILFVFENGAHISFGITTFKNGTVAIQSVNNGADDGKQIYKRFKDWGHLKDEEKAQYLADGVDFRVVRYGTDLLLYIGDRFVKVADLTNNNSGVTADMKATVSIRHWDDTGVEVVIPFKLSTEVNPITITSVESTHGKVVSERNTYFIGDTVTLSGKGKEGYYCTSMKVNGKEVSMNYDGTYTFTATEKNYTVEGTFDKQVFVYNSNWNLLKQNQGVVSLPNGGKGGTGTKGWLEFDGQYTDMDLTLTARDYHKDINTDRTDVLFIFENGAHVSFGVTTFKDGTVAIQTFNKEATDDGNEIYKTWKDWGHLTDAEKAQYQGEGVEFRVVRYGTDVLLYIGDRLVKVADLTNNDRGVTADTKANVYIRHWGDEGVEVVLPFEVTTELDKVTITSTEGEFGKVIGTRDNYLIGDKVTLSGKGKEGYYCTSMKVNGSEVSMNYDGTYTFTATENNYTVEGTFDKQVFVYNSNWNLLKQNQGVVSLPNGGKGGDGTKGWLEFDGQYTDIDLTLTTRDYHKDKHADERTDVLFIFENGAHVSFGITTFSSGDVAIQTFNKSATDDGHEIYKTWSDWGHLTDAEKAQYQGEGADFRIVRTGTDVYLYIGNRLLKVADLTNNDRGVTADTKANVYIRHWGDAGVQVDIPFTVSDTVDKVGGTMTISHTAANNTQARFVVANAVTDMDLNVTAKRHTEVSAGSEKIDVLFEFENGKNISFYLGVSSSKWRIRNLNSAGNTVNGADNTSIIYKRDDITWGTLSSEEQTQFMNGTLKIRIVRDGTDIMLYLGDRYLGTANLAKDYKGADTGVTADTKAKVTIRHYDNDTKGQVDIPFEMTKDLDKVTVITTTDGNGTVTTDRTKYMVGDTVALTVAGKSGYYYNTLKINGTEVEELLASDGTYTFVATGNNYNVEANFAEKTFVDNSSWNLVNQNKGVVSIPVGKGAATDANTDQTGWIKLSKQYENIDITVRARDDSSDTTRARTDVLFTFEVGGKIKHLSIGITRSGTNYRINSANLVANDGNQIYGQWTFWGTTGNLVGEEIQQYNSTGVQLRLVRSGTNLDIYVGERFVARADLTNNNSGVTANTKATVYIRHWGDKNVERVIPFTVSDTVSGPVASGNLTWFLQRKKTVG